MQKTHVQTNFKQDGIDLSDFQSETQNEYSHAVLTIGWSPMCLQLTH